MKTQKTITLNEEKFGHMCDEFIISLGGSWPEDKTYTKKPLFRYLATDEEVESAIARGSIPVEEMTEEADEIKEMFMKTFRQWINA